MDYIKGVYKRTVKAVMQSFKDTEDKNKRDTIHAQHNA